MSLKNFVDFGGEPLDFHVWQVGVFNKCPQPFQAKQGMITMLICCHGGPAVTLQKWPGCRSDLLVAVAKRVRCSRALTTLCDDLRAVAVLNAALWKQPDGGLIRGHAHDEVVGTDEHFILRLNTDNLKVFPVHGGRSLILERH
jgi:hypothetical protein